MSKQLDFFMDYQLVELKLRKLNVTMEFAWEGSH